MAGCRGVLGFSSRERQERPRAGEGATVILRRFIPIPLNLDPVVRQGYDKFYNLDYEGALALFNKVTAAHPNEPMAWNYVLLATLFRELYHQDLLDTTYYAHDSLSYRTSGRIQIPQATRQQIDDLTNKVGRDVRCAHFGQWAR